MEQSSNIMWVFQTTLPRLVALVGCMIVKNVRARVASRLLPELRKCGTRGAKRILSQPKVKHCVCHVSPSIEAKASNGIPGQGSDTNDRHHCRGKNSFGIIWRSFYRMHIEKPILS